MAKVIWDMTKVIWDVAKVGVAVTSRFILTCHSKGRLDTSGENDDRDCENGVKDKQNKMSRISTTASLVQ